MFIVYRTLAGEFCVLNGEFSDLRCLKNSLYTLGVITLAIFPFGERLLALPKGGNFLCVNVLHIVKLPRGNFQGDVKKIKKIFS